MDSIEEPKSAWKDGELDPIAIKSDGKMAVPWRRQINVSLFSNFLELLPFLNSSTPLPF